MTVSIVGRCASTGQLGIAISSSSICVGARCPWVRAGVGAVSTQNVTLPALGPQVLDMLEHTLLAPQEALHQVLHAYESSEYRQVTVVDSAGRVAHFSGSQTLGTHAAVAGEQCVAAGNMLANEQVVTAMVRQFEASTGALAERLLAALQAGAAAGGEAGPLHSAALKVAGEHLWPLVDLRVDWADNEPLAALEKLWRAYQPQMQDYLTRALHPAGAPRYGVPGDA